MLTAKRKSVIRDLYDGPGRHYHTSVHLDHMLKLFDTIALRLENRTAVELAIYYHDVIYDPSSATNEADSNARLVADMSELVDAATLERASEMVLATVKHELPTSRTTECDCAHFLDIDLSILGTDPKRFDQYEEEVRREYHFVADEDFRSGRTAILERFLERDTLFFTSHFKRLYEENARSNLQRSILALNEKS